MFVRQGQPLIGVIARWGGPPQLVAARVAAFAQVCTILVTWQLWQARTEPPNLPAIGGLAHLDWGLPILGAGAVALISPRIGGPAHAAIFLLAVLGDQIRLQPECVSLGLLMAVLPFNTAGVTIARWHLVALWFWSGANKALSLGWEDSGAAFIAQSWHLPNAQSFVVFALPAMEMAVGLAALRWSWRRFTAVGAAALHLGIFLTLSPWLADWNISVWPWNVGLAVVAPLVLWNWRPSSPSNTNRATISTRIIKPTAALLCLSPLLFYWGPVDTYLAHNLYTGNEATPQVCSPEGTCTGPPFSTWSDLNVPVPPEGRLYRAWFRRICEPGETLVVRSIRTRVTARQQATRTPCPKP